MSAPNNLPSAPSMGSPMAGGAPSPVGPLGAGIPQLPNPFTPLAFIPPDIAIQSNVATFVLVGCLTTVIWDILNNLRSDYFIVARRKFGLPTAVYFFSRILTLAYQLTTVILSTAPINNCRVASIVANSLFPFVIPSTSLLLFFQVRAIYIRNNYIVGFFGFMWLAVLASCTTPVIQAASGFNIGPTKFCAMYGVQKPYSSAPAIVVLVNDTLMFAAIVYKVLQCSMAPSNDVKAGVKTILFGTSLPTLSRALLQNGQAYFLSTVGINLITLIMFYNTSVPTTYREVMGVPDIILMNIMAGRIFRNTKLGIFNLPSQSGALGGVHNLAFAPQSGAGMVINVSKQSEKMPASSSDTLNTPSPTKPSMTMMQSNNSQFIHGSPV